MQCSLSFCLVIRRYYCDKAHYCSKKKALLTHLSGPEDKGKLAFVSYVLIILLTSTKRNLSGEFIGAVKDSVTVGSFSAENTN